MSAIVIGPSPIAQENIKTGTITPADYMPFAARHLVGEEINRLWEEFVTEMHDGSTNGPEVAAKFWKYVTR